MDYGSIEMECEKIDANIFNADIQLIEQDTLHLPSNINDVQGFKLHSSGKLD